MIKAILVGACGKMGNNICDCAENDSELKIVCGVDKFNNGKNFPIFPTFAEINVDADVLIDFSSVALLDDLLDFAKSKKMPVVIATTGYSDAQIEKIKAASKEIPVFFTFNMSIGVNLLCTLAKKAASILGDGFDVEIIEKHHNQKIDAPSGTAIMLGNAINSVFDDKLNYEYDRHSKRAKRPKNEIGFHSVRGGTIVGEHDVIFAGRDEVITLSHQATSKQVFAVGAIRAAKFISDKPAGLYDMNNILNFD
jgi:4-hydroxy-tetrahydrodipicolinate reductase